MRACYVDKVLTPLMAQRSDAIMVLPGAIIAMGWVGDDCVGEPWKGKARAVLVNTMFVRSHGVLDANTPADITQLNFDRNYEIHTSVLLLPDCSAVGKAVDESRELMQGRWARWDKMQEPCSLHERACYLDGVIGGQRYEDSSDMIGILPDALVVMGWIGQYSTGAAWMRKPRPLMVNVKDVTRVELVRTHGRGDNVISRLFFADDGDEGESVLLMPPPSEINESIGEAKLMGHQLAAWLEEEEPA
jgi:hypothetical protein